MIAKILKSSKNFYGAALYNQKKVDKGSAKIIAFQNVAGTKPHQLERFLKQVSKVSQTKKPVFHMALSFSPKDKPKLDDAFLQKVSAAYLDKMGYGKQPYIIYRHDDTKHPHVHILSTRIDINSNKKINDSHEIRRSKAITDTLEKTYKLTIADHQTKAHKHITKDLQAALKNAPTSIAQLNKSLGKNDSEFRAKAAGRGFAYYKIGNVSEANMGTETRTSRTWKSSDFKAEGLDKKGLEKQFEANRIDRKQLKSVVENTLKGNQKMTISAFETALAKHEIKPVFSVKKDSIQHNVIYKLEDVYGLNYQYEGRNFKASDLGKAHSWNQIKGHFGDSKSNSLRENLSESIVQGATIEVHEHLSAEAEDGKLHFESTNPQLQEQLNALPNEQANELVQLHDEYQDRIYHDPLMNDRALIKGMAGDDIDEYLQRQYRYKQEQSKRNFNERHR